MFKDLKISTGINILFGLLIACVVMVSTYALISSRSTADNFDDAVMTNNNIDMLNSAIVGMTGGIAQINGAMLATMINQPPEQADIDKAKKMLTAAEAQMDKFMSTPFQTEEEQVKWFTEFGHLNRGDMLTSEQHRCHNEKKKFQRRV
ncbi:Tar ligand binding domain-containing protein [Kosakonia sacchari]|uniref:Tar ligand binding domain-containing protein n=1 Tax=Kosakonia sacchari TaxID=1158459 RepID=UPI0032D97BB4